MHLGHPAQVAWDLEWLHIHMISTGRCCLFVWLRSTKVEMATRASAAAASTVSSSAAGAAAPPVAARAGGTPESASTIVVEPPPNASSPQHLLVLAQHRGHVSTRTAL